MYPPFHPVLSSDDVSSDSEPDLVVTVERSTKRANNEKAEKKKKKGQGARIRVPPESQKTPPVRGVVGGFRRFLIQGGATSSARGGVRTPKSDPPQQRALQSGHASQDTSPVRHVRLVHPSAGQKECADVEFNGDRIKIQAPRPDGSGHHRCLPARLTVGLQLERSPRGNRHVAFQIL